MPTRPLALITGASSGIGLELARVAAADGHDLLLVARRAPVLASLGNGLAEEFGVAVQTVTADLAGESGVDAVLRDLDRPVDVLVNNAGVGGVGTFAGSRALADDLAMVALNVTSLVRLTGELLPAMVERGSGGVLNVASTAGFLPGPGQAVYYATKAFVRSFSHALAEENRGHGVRVTALSPGPVDTGFADAAGLDSALLMRLGAIKVSAADVARASWRGLAAGRAEVVPGLLIRGAMASLRLTPTAVARKVAQRANR